MAIFLAAFHVLAEKYIFLIYYVLFQNFIDFGKILLHFNFLNAFIAYGISFNFLSILTAFPKIYQLPIQNFINCFQTFIFRSIYGGFHIF